MLRKFVLLGIFVGGCAALPALHELNPEAIDHFVAMAMRKDADRAEPPARKAELSIVSTPIAAASDQPLLGRKVVLQSDASGHFVGDFRLNGRSISALVDTGATVVAINQSTARRIGIALLPGDFKYEVQTANGKTKAASATIARMQIGRISVENIEAVVLEDRALGGTLVGMSFLKRLSKFQMQDGGLLLQQ